MLIKNNHFSDYFCARTKAFIPGQGKILDVPFTTPYRRLTTHPAKNKKGWSFTASLFTIKDAIIFFSSQVLLFLLFSL
jgi:hypothetical protein